MDSIPFDMYHPPAQRRLTLPTFPSYQAPRPTASNTAGNMVDINPIPTTHEQQLEPLPLTRENLMLLDHTPARQQSDRKGDVDTSSIDTGHDNTSLYIDPTFDAHAAQQLGTRRRRKHRHHFPPHAPTYVPPKVKVDYDVLYGAANYNDNNNNSDKQRMPFEGCACRGCHDTYAVTRLVRWEDEGPTEEYWNSQAFIYAESKEKAKRGRR